MAAAEPAHGAGAGAVGGSRDGPQGRRGQWPLQSPAPAEVQLRLGRRTTRSRQARSTGTATGSPSQKETRDLPDRSSPLEFFTACLVGEQKMVSVCADGGHGHAGSGTPGDPGARPSAAVDAAVCGSDAAGALRACCGILRAATRCSHITTGIRKRASLHEGRRGNESGKRNAAS